jgi:hypothetical protein
MNSSTVRITLVAVVWLITLWAAYQFGKSAPSALSGDDAAAADSMAVAAAPGWGVASPGQVSRSGNSALGERVSSGVGSVEQSADAAGGVVEHAVASGKIIDVPELIASMRAQFGSGSAFVFNASAMLKIMAPIADLSKAQIFEALDEVVSTVDGQQQKMIFHQLLLSRLAEVDGEAAMIYLSKNLSDQNNLANGLSMTVMAGWAQREPDTAWRWFMDNRDDMPSGPTGDNQLQFIFSGMAAQDVAGAFRRLEELDEFDKTRAVSGIAMGAGLNSGSRVELLERAAGLPDELRDTLYQGVFGQWAVTAPEDAIAWVRGLPEEAKKKVLQQGSYSLLYSNPELGADFMLENASKDDLPSTYANIVGNWGAQNPNAAGEWLNEQPQGPHLDEARLRFARMAVQRDPYSAMEWAKTVETEAKRIQAIREVYMQWRGKNAADADDALDSSGLRQAMVEEIRQALTNTALP